MKVTTVLSVGEVVSARLIGPDAAGNHRMERGPGLWLVLAVESESVADAVFTVAQVHLNDGMRGNALLIVPDDERRVPLAGIPGNGWLADNLMELRFEVQERREYVVRQQD